MMVPYTELDVNAAVAMVFHQRNVNVMGTFISVGATAGLLGNIWEICLHFVFCLYLTISGDHEKYQFEHKNKTQGIQ